MNDALTVEQHRELALFWCRYVTGKESQDHVQRTMLRHGANELRRRLIEKGVALPAGVSLNRESRGSQLSGGEFSSAGRQRGART